MSKAKKEPATPAPTVIATPKLYPNGDCFNIEIESGYAKYFICAYSQETPVTAMETFQVSDPIGTKVQIKFTNLPWLAGHPVADMTYKVIVQAQNGDGSVKSDPASFMFKAKSTSPAETPPGLVSVGEALEKTEPKLAERPDPVKSTTPPVIITPPAAVPELPAPAVEIPAEPVLPPTPVSLPAQAPADEKKASLSDVLLANLQSLEVELDEALAKFLGTGRVPTEAFLKACANRLENSERRLHGAVTAKPESKDCYNAVMEKGQEVLDKLQNLEKIRADNTPAQDTPPVKPSGEGGDPREVVRRALRENKPPTPPATAPALTQAPAPDFSERVDGLEEEIQELKGTLDDHTKGLKKAEEGIKEVRTEVTAIGQRVDAGTKQTSAELNLLMEAVKGLKLATPSDSTPPPPQQPFIQHIYPPSKDNAGTGGDGNDGSGGGKASTEKPWSLGSSWFGALVALAILFIIGPIALCAFQAGWIHKSPNAGATYMGGSAQQPPLVVTVTNVVSQTTPPTGGQQAVVAPPPTLTPDQIKAYAAENLRIQSEHNKAIEALVANANPPPTRQTAEATGGRSTTVTGGDNSVVAGRDVTIVNYNYPPPTSSGNGEQVVSPTVTSSSTGWTSSSEQARTANWPGPQIVRTLPHWDPTRMAGKTQIKDLYGPGTGLTSE